MCTLLRPPSTVSLSPQQPVVCLPGLPLRNIKSAILSQVPVLLECSRPYSTTAPTPLSVLPAPPLYRLRPGPSSRSWNFVCVAQHRRRGPVKRVECIALRCQGCNVAHCGAKRGRQPCNAKCSFLLRSRVERGMALQRGERGGRALVT